MLREACVEMGGKPRSSVVVVVFQSESSFHAPALAHVNWYCTAPQKQRLTASHLRAAVPA